MPDVSRRAASMTRRTGRMLPAILRLAAPALLPFSAMGADVFVQNSGYVGAETNSNVDLTPGGQAEVNGYSIDLASLIGIATPNSETNIRPRVDYREYPTETDDNRLEEYLDFNSYYKGQRSSFAISGTLDHRDEFNAEQNSAEFNELNPNQPTSPQTGRTITGATRDSVYAVPSYTYSISPLFSVGANALYEKVNYSPNDNQRFVDFNYYQAKAFVIWTLNPKSDLTFGAYGNKFNATRFDSKETAEGGQVDLNTTWTPLFSTHAQVVLQRADINYGIAPGFVGSVNAWGGLLGALYKTQTQAVRFNLTRLITPSGGGSVYVSNQAQVQYDQRFTQRLSFTTATIYLQNRALTEQASGDGRNYLRSVISAKWMVSRTFYIQGGYQYTWQKYQLDPDGAANNRFFVQFGYQGLGRQW
jgi:hypothetical protein